MWVTGPTQVERVKVIETSSSAWKAGILTIVLTLHSFKYHLYNHLAILILGNWFYFIIPPTSINRPILMKPSETGVQVCSTGSPLTNISPELETLLPLNSSR